MLVYVILIIGFILLIKGADYFVDGSCSVAKKLKIPTMIIGLTIVAMGTSAPECAVSISASMQGSNALSISNIVGSNIFNLMVVIGACCLFVPIKVDDGTLRKEFPFSILVAVIMLVFCADAAVRGIFTKTPLINEMGRLDGFILQVIFIGFLYWMIQSALKARKAGTETEYEKEAEIEGGEIKPLSGMMCVVYIIGGIAAIVIGGNMVVDSAREIALQWGMSETMVGLTVVAFGTSLPELVTSIVAARKNEVDMALGNVIGSNIFNILLVGGIAAVVRPIAISGETLIDIMVLIVMSILVLGFAWNKKQISKGEGICMLITYAIYIVYICMR